MKRFIIFAAAFAVAVLALAAIPHAAFAAPVWAQSLADSNSLVPAALTAMVALPAMREFGVKKAGEGDGDEGGDQPDLKDIAKKFQEATDQVKNLGEDIKSKYEAGKSVTDELKQKADEALTGFNELKTELEEIQQKLVRRGGGQPERAKSWGEQVAEAEGLEEYRGRRGKAGKLTIDVKTITSATGSGGELLTPQYVPGVVTPPDRRMTVRDLLTPGRTDQQSIIFFQETGFTNNAAVVSETVQKPESEITFDQVTRNVTTIAHWVAASKQILADAPMLQSFIDGRLRYGLAYAEEQQLLNGDGTGQNLEGLITAATACSAPFSVSGETMIDRVRLALLQAALAEYPSTGVVMHPSDWTRIETEKDSQGRYIVGNPQGVIQPTLWGVPVVATQAITVDKFLAGAFKLGAQVFDREDAAVMISDEDGDNFKKNMVTVLAEERLALAIYRPEAFIYGDFGNV